MHDAPSSKELLEAVKAFIDATAMPNLSGHAAFHARVASNALAIVLREMDLRPDSEADEHNRLQALLGSDAGREALGLLNRDLCDKIRSGEFTLNTPGLLEHLKRTTIDQLLIDQPKYSGLNQAQDAP